MTTIQRCLVASHRALHLVFLTIFLLLEGAFPFLLLPFLPLLVCNILLRLFDQIMNLVLGTLIIDSLYDLHCHLEVDPHLHT